MTNWSSSQIAIAEDIYKVAIDDGLGQAGATIGIMTAIDESTLTNVMHGDQMGPSSIGVFQQMGPWGPLSVRTNPTGAAGLFFDALQRVSGWQSMEPWLAAQAVQQSEFSDGRNYEACLPDARALVAQIAGGGGFTGILAGIGTAVTNAVDGLVKSTPTRSITSPDGGAGSDLFNALGFGTGTTTAPTADQAALAKLPKLGNLPSVTYLPFRGRQTVDASNRLADITLAGAKLHSELSSRTVSAGMSYSSTQVNQFTVVMQDTPDGVIARSGLIRQGVKLDFADQHTDIRGIAFADGHGAPQITVKGRSRVVSALKSHDGPGNWGKMAVDTWVRERARESGAEVICGPFPDQQTITRQADLTTPETTWDVMQRLAQTVGAICFEFDQIIVFGKPTWLAKRPFHKRWQISWTSYSKYSKNLNGMPVYVGSADSADSLTFGLVGDYNANIRPGDIVTLYGSLAAGNGDWFVTGVDIAYALGQPVSVTCARIIDPKLPAATKTAADGTATGNTNSTVDSTGDAVGRAAAQFALTKVGGPYVYAGDGPTAYDCSGLTHAAWLAQGYNIPRVSYEQATLPAVPLDQLQPGDLVTYYSPVSHVAIYVGGGDVVSAADEALGIIEVPYQNAGPNPTGHRVPRH